jgi:chemotaxis methyl-accepting protein methylase
MTVIKDFSGELTRLFGDQTIAWYEPKFLVQVIDGRMAEKGISLYEKYLDYLQQSQEEQLTFRQTLLNGFSEFFRSPVTFAILTRLILPELLDRARNRENREIRIWSAAASGGQEVYSLAMILDEMIASRRERFTVRFFATDLNPAVLTLAEAGIYDAQHLQQVPLKYLTRYFTVEQGRYKIIPEIRKIVDFSVFNLLSDDRYCPPACIYGDFDLVMCANILFYYKEKVQKLILSKVARCLTKGGYLVTGDTERTLITGRQFSEIYPPSAIYAKKN